MELDDVWTVTPSREISDIRELRIDFNNDWYLAAQFKKGESAEIVSVKLINLGHKIRARIAESSI